MEPLCQLFISMNSTQNGTVELGYPVGCQDEDAFEVLQLVKENSQQPIMAVVI